MNKVSDDVSSVEDNFLHHSHISSIAYHAGNSNSFINLFLLPGHIAARPSEHRLQVNFTLTVLFKLGLTVSTYKNLCHILLYHHGLPKCIKHTQKSVFKWTYKYMYIIPPLRDKSMPQLPLYLDISVEGINGV